MRTLIALALLSAPAFAAPVPKELRMAPPPPTEEADFPWLLSKMKYVEIDLGSAPLVRPQLFMKIQPRLVQNRSTHK